MSGEPEKEFMDIDSPGECSKESPERVEGGNGLHLFPVDFNDSGEGLPYAPQDWPNPGDNWRWKVGRRTTVTGFYLDRYMYVPRRLRQRGEIKGFASRSSLKNYIRTKFPDADVDAFFASFSWKIPSSHCKKANERLIKPPEEKATGSDDVINELHCKAGNRFCSSLDGEEPDLEVMFCDICCGEPGFCRDCCCILCCQTIDKVSESYGYIRCEAIIDGSACGHCCHIECALRSYLAGTVGGNIGLDAEYYCRRCDSRSDLVSHVANLLQNCEANASRGDIEKTLNVGISVLRGSKKTNAKHLFNHIQLAMSKLNNGTSTEDILKKEDAKNDSAGPPPNDNGASRSPETEELQDSQPPTLSSSFDYRVESLKLDIEIDEILDSLRKSQEIEYRLAEERLSAQRNYVINLYEQLDRERSSLSRHTSSSSDQDSLLDSVLDRIERIKQEVSRLKDMGEVANGFGRVPKRILEQHFGIDVEL